MSEISKSHFPVIEVASEKETKILVQGPFPTSHPYPEEPGVYQLRPVGKVWSITGPEHAAWIPVFGWVPGILAPEEMSQLSELPETGVAK